MKRKIIILALMLSAPLIFAADFGPVISQADIDTLLASYPAIKPDLDSLFVRMSGAQRQSKEFAEKVDKSSQMLEVFLFYNQSQSIAINDYIKTFRDIVTASKPQEMRELFNRYNLGDNGFGKYFFATTTVLVLYTQKYYSEEKAKFSPNSEEMRYLEGKLASIGEFLNSIHPDDLSRIKKSSHSILKTCM